MAEKGRLKIQCYVNDTYIPIDGTKAILRPSAGQQGESKEVILVATKKLSSTSIGRITNVAEIQSSLNIKNLSDIDSKEGNRNTEEDDYSEAEILISVKTGIATNIAILFFGMKKKLLIV